MDKEIGISQAYYGVYCSSKEILNNNQRHLFCSMLDLLARTCKTTGIAGSKVISDDQSCKKSAENKNNKITKTEDQQDFTHSSSILPLRALTISSTRGRQETISAESIKFSEIEKRCLSEKEIKTGTRPEKIRSGLPLICNTIGNKQHNEKELSESKKENYIETKSKNEHITPEKEYIQILSPKTMVPKISLLSSPPDRKVTNNSSSPTLKHKPPAHLTGRGAQLINMIRNKRYDSSSFAPISLTQKPFESGDLLISMSGDQTSNTIVQNDLLMFSKRIPSTTASPSASILKRKHRRDSFEDIFIDSPALKRKRVSFHDPPVSITKEYITDGDEEKHKQKRCLISDRKSGTHDTSGKHILKRKSKFDSNHEIEKYSIEQCTKSQSQISTNLTSRFTNYECICSLKNNKNDNSCLSTPFESVVEKKNLSFTNHAALLNYITQQFALEDILEMFSVTESSLTSKSANILSKLLCNCMKTNPKIKLSVMEKLSENHSKDFLDHAVQENLSSVVCDRLNLNSVIEFVCAKSEISTLCRHNLLSQVSEIFKHNKLESERFTLVCNLISSGNFTDENIFNLIQMIVNKRVTTELLSEAVSESAIDSSSNL